MSAHKSNNLLRYGSIGLGGFLLLIMISAGIKSCSHAAEKISVSEKINSVRSMASGDSEAESLDTLTADLNNTKKQIEQVIRDNNELKQRNIVLEGQLSSSSTKSFQGTSNDKSKTNNSLDKEHVQYPIGSSVSDSKALSTPSSESNMAQPLTTISDLTVSMANKNASWNIKNSDHADKNQTLFSDYSSSNITSKEKPKAIPYYTIPANATAVHDRLMTALVGRIPVKGVVTDPYPFKIVFSDNTLAANGLRVPHLKQMIVSGFTEGDLNLKVVRGWITSLTFVFEDGTISSTTSNDNNIGKFTKENALGYLTDEYGNPIQGTLISNAPEYLGTKVGLGLASGFATAYAQSQVNSQSNPLGGATSTVTGSPGKFMLGQGLANGTNQASSWFEDRAESSFDAIYVPTIDKEGRPVEISVNFAKEIPINYDPTGRKVTYEQTQNIATVNSSLD